MWISRVGRVVGKCEVCDIRHLSTGLMEDDFGCTGVPLAGVGTGVYVEVSVAFTDHSHFQANPSGTNNAANVERVSNALRYGRVVRAAGCNGGQAWIALWRNVQLLPGRSRLRKRAAPGLGIVEFFIDGKVNDSH